MPETLTPAEVNRRCNLFPELLSALKTATAIASEDEADESDPALKACEAAIAKAEER